MLLGARRKSSVFKKKPPVLEDWRLSFLGLRERLTAVAPVDAALPVKSLAIFHGIVRSPALFSAIAQMPATVLLIPAIDRDANKPTARPRAGAVRRTYRSMPVSWVMRSAKTQLNVPTLAQNLQAVLQKGRQVADFCVLCLAELRLDLVEILVRIVQCARIGSNQSCRKKCHPQKSDE